MGHCCWCYCNATLYHGTALEIRHVFPSGPLPESLPITGIAHIFSLSFLSQHGQAVTQPWPHLQLGLGVVAVAPSAQAALPQHRHFSNEPIWLGCSCPHPFHLQRLLQTSPSTTIHGWREGCIRLKLVSIQGSSSRHSPTVVSAWEKDQSAELWGWWPPNHKMVGPFLPGTGEDGSPLCYQLILIYDDLCAPVSSNYKRKRWKEIAKVHLVSSCKFVKNRQRLIKDPLHAINYFFLNDYK